MGFGDAFLVTVPTSEGERKILFDCGSIAKGPKSIGDVSKQIIADCTVDGSGPAIDVIVATHRHKDHVSGFATAGWAEVAVQEVWMPWTEDESDKTAKEIRDAQSKLTASLALSFTGNNLAQLALAADGPTNNLALGPTLLLNAMSNAKAMDLLHHGFVGNPRRRFLPKLAKQDSANLSLAGGKKAPIVERSFVTDVLPGVTVHVLGPSRDEKVIKEMDPPKGKSYMQLQAERAMSIEELCRPFAEEFEFHENEMTSAYMDHINLSDRRDIGRGTDYSALEVAVALDSAVNGTSLMLMLEIGGTYLLFPGDAQWGTWNAAMNDPEWSEMLSKTSFYKVGHHCSHNATPKAFVEDSIGDAITAMASTMERSIWPSIPREPLLRAFAHKNCRLARSDKEDKADPNTFTVVKKNYIETHIPF
ncbi:MAG: hypothetical protein IPP88_02635 [Betaproteobacteria bacterium]|nr:hypothetical protein [Betaproteobacteria bacterium]